MSTRFFLCSLLTLLGRYPPLKGSDCMVSVKKEPPILMKPIYSGPRPDIDRQRYEKQCRYLDDLVNNFSVRFHAQNIENDSHIEQLCKEAIALKKLCEDLARK